MTITPHHFSCHWACCAGYLQYESMLLKTSRIVVIIVNDKAIISREKRPHSPVHGQLQQPPCCFTLFGCGADQPKRFPLMKALSIPLPAVTASAAQGRSLAQSRTLIHSPRPSRQFQRWAGTCYLLACVFARNTLYAVHRAEDVQRMYVLRTLCVLYGAQSSSRRELNRLALSQSKAAQWRPTGTTSKCSITIWRVKSRFPP